MKKCIRFLVFILIASVLFSYFNQLFARKSLYGWWNITTKTHGFFNSKKDEYDVLFFGTSHSYASFNPLIINKETGISSYVLATQKQPLWATYYYMMEAIPRQHPTAIVFDCYATSFFDEYSDEATTYTYCDDFPLSKNKLLMIKESSPDFKTAFSYLFKFTKYHSRWGSLEQQDFNYNPKKLHDYLGGYCMLCGANETIERCDIKKIDADCEILEKNKLYLDKIIKLAKDYNIKLYVVKTPSNETEDERFCYNTVKKICLENDITFIDFNEYYDEIGLDIKTDFYDHSHLNFHGAEKFSEYFAKNCLFGIQPKGITKDYSRRMMRYEKETDENFNVFSYKPMIFR